MQFQVCLVLKAMRISPLKFCQWNIGKAKVEVVLGFSWVGHNIVSKKGQYF